jgi:hypothetical protein
MAASTATTAPRRARARSARHELRPPKVRWDRLGRLAMLCVLAALVYLYLSAGATLLSTWRESKRADAQVVSLQRAHRQLEAQHAMLKSPGTVEAEARQLGMMFPNEHTFIVRGLPDD